MQLGVDAVRDGALAAATESGEPDDAAARSLNGLLVPGNKSFVGHRDFGWLLEMPNQDINRSTRIVD